MVFAVNQCDLNRQAGDTLRGSQTSETCAYD
jgi:hypothetical protein